MARGGMRVKVIGLKRVQRKMFALGKDGEKAFRGAMYAEGLHIIDQAVENAPVVTKRLRNSHFVTLPDKRGALEIGFATVYAAAVEYGLKLIKASRRQQKAAFASMREIGWRKSSVGGPAYMRRAISSTDSGRVRRIANTAMRYFKAGIGVIPSGKPESEEEGRAKGS